VVTGEQDLTGLYISSLGFKLTGHKQNNRNKVNDFTIRQENNVSREVTERLFMKPCLTNGPNRIAPLKYKQYKPKLHHICLPVRRWYMRQ